MRLAGKLTVLALLLLNVPTDAQMMALPVWQYRKLIVHEITTSNTSARGWIVPAGVTSLESVEAWGGGAGPYISSSSENGGGGGGGAYSLQKNVAVNPGDSLDYIVGVAGGPGESAGGTYLRKGSTYYVYAEGGRTPSSCCGGGAGGDSSSVNTVGTSKASGGNGGSASGGQGGAGGGGSAGPNAANTATTGANGGNSSGGSGAAGGASGSGAGGGLAGGSGSNGAGGTSNPAGGGGGGGGGNSAEGASGGYPGGGAGSSGRNGNSYGHGAPGKLRITYYRMFPLECPVNFIPVPPLAPYTTDGFCVAKYEMKQNGVVPISKPDSLPWTGLTRSDMILKCQGLGAGNTGYDLISNREWQTIARNIESVASNWQSGSIGTVLNKGNTVYGALLAAGTDDTNGCFGYPATTCFGNTWVDEKRTHTLTNGAVIWDFSGSAWETLKDDYSDLILNPRLGTTPAYQFNAIGGINSGIIGPSNASWTDANGVGRAFFPNSTNTTLVRGGAYNNTFSGIYGISNFTYSAGETGFRCVYNP